MLVLPVSTHSNPQVPAAFMKLRIDPDSPSHTSPGGYRGLPQVAETKTTRPMDVAGQPLL